MRTQWIVLTLILVGCGQSNMDTSSSNHLPQDPYHYSQSAYGPQPFDFLTVSAQYRFWDFPHTTLTPLDQQLLQANIAVQQRKNDASRRLQHIPVAKLTDQQYAFYARSYGSHVARHGQLDRLVTIAPQLEVHFLRDITWPLLGHAPLEQSDPSWQALNNILLSNTPDELPTWKQSHPEHPLSTSILSQPQWPKLERVYIWQPNKETQQQRDFKDVFFNAYFHDQKPSWPIEVLSEPFSERLTANDWVVGLIDQPSLDLLHHRYPKAHFLSMDANAVVGPNTLVPNNTLATPESTMKHAKASGFEHALLITYYDTYSTHELTEIQNEWRRLGGNIIDTVLLEPGKEQYLLSKALKLSDSAERTRQISKIVKQPLKKQHYRRHDFDVVFLFTPANKTLSVNPLLTFLYTKTPRYTLSTLTKTSKHKEDKKYLIAHHTRKYNNLNEDLTHEILTRNRQPSLSEAQSQAVRAYQIIDHLDILRWAPEYHVSALGEHWRLDHDKHLVFTEHFWYTHSQPNSPLERA